MVCPHLSALFAGTADFSNSCKRLFSRMGFYLEKTLRGKTRYHVPQGYYYSCFPHLPPLTPLASVSPVYIFSPTSFGLSSGLVVHSSQYSTTIIWTFFFLLSFFSYLHRPLFIICLLCVCSLSTQGDSQLSMLVWAVISCAKTLLSQGWRLHRTAAGIQVPFQITHLLQEWAWLSDE